VSELLPGNWWAWVARVGVCGLPSAWETAGSLRPSRAGWHQPLAAFCVNAFLLKPVLPHLGVYTARALDLCCRKNAAPSDTKPRKRSH